MRVINKKIFFKLIQKNKGNVRLKKEIEMLLAELESSRIGSLEDLNTFRKDADKVHNDGFFFFNLHIHRTMVFIKIDDFEEAEVVWVGTHQAYEQVFRNSKEVIEKWLRSNGWIKK
jgi:hypothetical protein